ncbi:phosphocarrier protein [Alkalithermobacter thermoalcaliphilus JW-YL-7 = DSM 7308]|uniref:Phosphocarrier protein HPr n=1 Tax=Alkalithermobacter thermoalcaliphilus JW-YL-7 = DSM 7308 TaxID=1121328 RepID=A0A150FS59_CLOPD|nr:Phosphotransferase system, phosphocarrier protein HPr [[Clostridium] paradoxum JW-YL-7 = DSM 7308]SHL15484.1 phosphocarrier protein [[Clostridium] paradoxum JW-YL-7 = DSM 7308]
MIKKEFEILSSIGLHARPAALFVQTANKFESEITVIKDQSEINGKSIMGIMALAVSKGEKITIIVDGKDEKQAMDALEELLTKRFAQM